MKSYTPSCQSRPDWKAFVEDNIQLIEYLQEALEAHTWNKNAAANWLLQGGSNLPPLPALRRSTTDRASAYSPTGQPGEALLPAACLATASVSA